MHIAWLARNQLHVKRGDSVTIVTSQFAENARKKSAEMVQRNAWKTQNAGALFMGARGAQQLETEVPVYLTGITSQAGGALLYSMELRDVSGVFEVSEDGQDERRLFHGNVGGLRDLARHPMAKVVAAVTSNVKAGTSHVCLVGLNGEGVTVLTDGDAVERHPSWVPGAPQVLIYESSGVGRAPDGQFAGLGPSSVVRLDASTSGLTTLAEDARFDFVQPRLDSKSQLYFVRRPWAGAARVQVSLGSAFMGALLFPFRLLRALLGFFNFFSLRYSGKPLLGGGNARAQEADLRRLMLWGNLASAQQNALGQMHDEELKAIRAPNDWVLIRRGSTGDDEVLLKSVATWDLRADGTILYSDGVDISLRHPDGRTERVASDDAVQSVAFLAER